MRDVLALMGIPIPYGFEGTPGSQTIAISSRSITTNSRQILDFFGWNSITFARQGVVFNWLLEHWRLEWSESRGYARASESHFPLDDREVAEAKAVWDSLKCFVNGQPDTKSIMELFIIE
ncbi:hypothetical protein VKT23_017663 [Stygiomarasmius scandens]|uniref:Uncharacterized protein n=1 Tax=Marasmiellus scandens TaxID=2682957 RepID=A0ABR1IRL8_9AGAR